MPDEDFPDPELRGFPPLYGTKKCYDCGKEPQPDDNWWHRFVEQDGKQYSVPQCDECGEKMEEEIRKHGSKKHEYTHEELCEMLDSGIEDKVEFARRMIDANLKS